MRIERRHYPYHNDYREVLKRGWYFTPPGAFGLFLLVVLVIWLTGCVPQHSDTPLANNIESAAPASNQKAPGPERAAYASPVTLPLIDAMLADESFANEVKSTLQLTDEQLQKLRDAARNEVLQLSEDSDDYARSTAAALREAEKKIREVLGDEKGSRFILLVRDRGAGLDPAQIANAEPNSVPADTRIVVNAPAYRMDIFENGRLKKTYRVGIGYPEFPLPTGLRRADTIIFNPSWTPPDEPWVKGKYAPGRKVEAGSKDNPLGMIKIPIGLPSLIHGGKHPSRMGKFASHGCVGLTNDQVRNFAIELASLGASPVTLDDIKKLTARKTETKEHKLANPVPVELRYETIVVQDGKLYIYRDVYEHGTNNEETLRRVLQAAGVSLENLERQTREQLLAALEEMAADAKGNPVDPDGNSSSNRSNANSSGRVTREIKGKKETVIEIAQLRGKGYPAPVGLEG